jgi:hypothetical protein
MSNNAELNKKANKNNDIPFALKGVKKLTSPLKMPTAIYDRYYQGMVRKYDN